MRCLETGQTNYNEINMSMKEQYHTFQNENRKAEVFKEASRKWLIECYENETETHTCTVATELLAELYADNWVLKVINNESYGISD
jgi:hypothetical protein